MTILLLFTILDSTFFFSQLSVSSSHWVVPLSHMTVLLSHSTIPLFIYFFFSYLMNLNLEMIDRIRQPLPNLNLVETRPSMPNLNLEMIDTIRQPLPNLNPIEIRRCCQI